MQLIRVRRTSERMSFTNWIALKLYEQKQNSTGMKRLYENTVFMICSKLIFYLLSDYNRRLSQSNKKLLWHSCGGDGKQRNHEWKARENPEWKLHLKRRLNQWKNLQFFSKSSVIMNMNTIKRCDVWQIKRFNYSISLLKFCRWFNKTTNFPFQSFVEKISFSNLIFVTINWNSGIEAKITKQKKFFFMFSTFSSKSFACFTKLFAFLLMILKWCENFPFCF
jgi:hypothetical protein